MARWQKYSCCAVHAYMQYSVVDGLWSAVRIDEIEYPQWTDTAWRLYALIVSYTIKIVSDFYT